jgi:cell shape-determining protein MreD
MLLLSYLQILFGNIALHFPLCIAGIFYISVAYSWRHGIFWALVCGISLDLFYNREFYTAAMAFSLAVLYAEYWLRNNDSRYLRNCFLPGALLALFSVLPIWVYKLVYYGSSPEAVFKEMLPLTISAMAADMLVLPLLVMLLDAIGEKIRLPLFAKAGKRLIEERKI